jgi:hypothetical protein
MIDSASVIREHIYSAIRAFTCATVAEAEAATKAIIRLVDNAMPDDGSHDEDAERQGELQ